MKEETKRDLYDLAFQFKRKKLWETQEERNIFAVQLSGGRIGYISLMGLLGAQQTLALFIGKEGFNSLWHFYQNYDGADEAAQLILILERNNIACCYNEDDTIRPEAIAEAKAWAKTLHRRITHPFPYPAFEKYAPLEEMQYITDEQEAQDLKLALQAGLFVCDWLPKQPKRFLSIPYVETPTDVVPIFIPDESAPGGFRAEETKLPGYEEPTYPAPSAIDEFTLKRLKRIKKTGVWEIGVTYSLRDRLDKDGRGVLPAVIFALSEETEMALRVFAIGCYKEDYEEMMSDFVQCILELGELPAAIKIRDYDRCTEAFLTPLIQQLSLPLKKKHDLPALSNALLAYMQGNWMDDDNDDDFDGDDDDDGIDPEDAAAVQFLFSAVRMSSIKELRKAPPEIQLMCQMLIEVVPEDVPDDVAKKIRACLPYWNK